jgi:hypothetical protein
MSLKLAACVGQRDSPAFAQEITAANHDIMRNARMAGRDVLLIGVPVTKDKKVAGVIEVVQRTDSPRTAQQGYLRFVSQMAHIFAGSSSLTLENAEPGDPRDWRLPCVWKWEGQSAAVA